MEPLPIPHRVNKAAVIKTLDQYKSLHKESIQQPEKFWTRVANELVDWFSPFTQAKHGDFQYGNIAWFLNGKLNITYNCLDRHLADRAHLPALKWEGNEIGSEKILTFAELHREVCQFANGLKSIGVKKGDRVAIYMPMTPEAAVAMVDFSCFLSFFSLLALELVPFILLFLVVFLLKLFLFEFKMVLAKFSSLPMKVFVQRIAFPLKKHLTKQWHLVVQSKRLLLSKELRLKLQ